LSRSQKCWHRHITCAPNSPDFREGSINRIAKFDHVLFAQLKQHDRRDLLGN
jgi:hypothetical protein